MSKLTELAQNLKNEISYADESTINQESPTAAAWFIRAGQAREALPGLTDAFRTAVMAESTLVVLKGSPDQQFEFRAIMESNVTTDGTPVIDTLSPYMRIAKMIEPTWTPSDVRAFGSTQYDLMCEGIRDIAIESGMVGSLPAPAAPNGTVVSDLDACARYIRNQVRAVMADSLSFAYLSSLLAKGVLDNGVQDHGKVLLANALPEEVTSFGSHFGKVSEIHFTKDQEVNADFVIYHIVGAGQTPAPPDEPKKSGPGRKKQSTEKTEL